MPRISVFTPLEMPSFTVSFFLPVVGRGVREFRRRKLTLFVVNQAPPPESSARFFLFFEHDLGIRAHVGFSSPPGLEIDAHFKSGHVVRSCRAEKERNLGGLTGDSCPCRFHHAHARVLVEKRPSDVRTSSTGLTRTTLTSPSVMTTWLRARPGWS